MPNTRTMKYQIYIGSHDWFCLTYVVVGSTDWPIPFRTRQNKNLSRSSTSNIYQMFGIAETAGFVTTSVSYQQLSGAKWMLSLEFKRRYKKHDDEHIQECRLNVLVGWSSAIHMCYHDTKLIFLGPQGPESTHCLCFSHTVVILGWGWWWLQNTKSMMITHCPLEDFSEIFDR